MIIIKEHVYLAVSSHRIRGETREGAGIVTDG